MLWEEQVPLLKEGRHKEIENFAYGKFSQGRKVYPLREHVFDSMRFTSFTSLKVVVLGQDPYINEHPTLGPEAHGLCFSVKDGISIPPSLRNIFKEINNSIYPGKKVEFSSDLTRWAKQGVLLLNASLTVTAKSSNSHAKIGWHAITDNIIETISRKKSNVVFLLWGAFAHKKAPLIDGNKHLILMTSHPSPLSAHRGFLGSGVFFRCNEYLKNSDMDPIVW